jgi:hypothetical protein
VLNADTVNNYHVLILMQARAEALIPLLDVNGVLPAWFPATITDLDELTADQANALVAFYGLGVDIGTTAEKISRLRFFVAGH